MIYKIFVDADILVDLFLDRLPFSVHAEKLFKSAAQNNYQLFTSSLVVANLHYIVHRNLGKDRAKACVINLLDNVQVLPVDERSIWLSMVSEFSDFEDGIQHVVANSNACDAIITRNIKHYKTSALPIFTAEQYLNTL